MCPELTKYVYYRASKSKDPITYVSLVNSLYELSDSKSDDEFIKEMEWEK